MSTEQADVVCEQHKTLIWQQDYNGTYIYCQACRKLLVLPRFIGAEEMRSAVAREFGEGWVERLGGGKTELGGGSG